LTPQKTGFGIVISHKAALIALRLHINRKQINVIAAYRTKFCGKRGGSDIFRSWAPVGHGYSSCKTPRCGGVLSISALFL
jgi:hypothetical protein